MKEAEPNGKLVKGLNLQSSNRIDLTMIALTAPSIDWGCTYACPLFDIGQEDQDRSGAGYSAKNKTSTA